MDRRAAKREACALVAAVIAGGVDNGLFAPEDDLEDAVDAARVREALDDLQREMHRRAVGC